MPDLTGIQPYVFEPGARPVVAVEGGGLFPVRRIFCVGRNYPEHVKEMFGDPKTTPPVFFTKPADAAVASGSAIPYPGLTSNLHYEGELALALGGGGRNIQSAEEARALVFGCAAGCDLTRRDLQAAAKKAGEPWDAAKGFDLSAPIGPIGRVADYPLRTVEGSKLTLSLNGEVRQNGPISDMTFAPSEIIIHLSRLFELRPGDLVFTGTPKGVGPLAPGDVVEVVIGQLPRLRFSIGPANP